MTVRIATFNAENLFARYRFRSNFDPVGEDGFSINDLAFDLYSDESKRLTARALREVNADIVCLQEVENVHVLERFNSRLLGGMGYKHRLVVDSHDPRFIDIGILSRYPFTYINTHRDERNAANTAWLFSRDCLEVDIATPEGELSLYGNHLKSMLDRNAPDGRVSTHPRRKEQAQAVRDIVDDYWRSSQYAGNYVVLGDLNDYPDSQTALRPLLSARHLVNIVNRLPSNERYTHFYARENQYRQLDYIFLSKALADANPHAPAIMRKGLPYRAEHYQGPRFDGVGEDHPKASDHAPLYMDLNLL